MSEANQVGTYRRERTFGGRESAQQSFVEALRGIALDSEGLVYAVGDSRVKVWSAEGSLLREWDTEQPGFCVAVDAAGAVWVGQWQQIEVFDGAGTRQRTWKDPEHLGLVTAIGFAEEDVFVADATARWIHRYDREGNLQNEIGDRHRKGGFHIPNGVVDFTVGDGSVLHVANPGMHRVERYRPDGEKLGHFGRFDGVDPAGFPGCCNPTNVALGPGGQVVVSEKAGPRVKVYDAAGNLLTVVDDRGFDPAAKNMDLAVDSQGRIYVADTVRLEIVVYGRGA